MPWSKLQSTFTVDIWYTIHVIIIIIISLDNLNSLLLVLLGFGYVMIIVLSFWIGWMAKRSQMFRGRHTRKIKKSNKWTEERGFFFFPLLAINYLIKFIVFLLKLAIRRFWYNLFPFCVLGRWRLQNPLRIFIPMHFNTASQVSLVLAGLVFNYTSDFVVMHNYFVALMFLFITLLNLFEHWSILSEDKQRTIDIETLCELFTIVLGSEFPSQVNLLIDYLKVSRCLYFFFVESSIVTLCYSALCLIL
jgi:hypothetical protein